MLLGKFLDKSYLLVCVVVKMEGRWGTDNLNLWFTRGLGHGAYSFQGGGHGVVRGRGCRWKGKFISQKVNKIIILFPPHLAFYLIVLWVSAVLS